MEKKDVLISALGVGLGVGTGLGLASRKTVGNWTAAGDSSPILMPEIVEEELMRMVFDGRESKVAFHEFPCYLRLCFPSCSLGGLIRLESLDGGNGAFLGFLNFLWCHR